MSRSSPVRAPIKPAAPAAPASGVRPSCGYSRALYTIERRSFFPRTAPAVAPATPSPAPDVAHWRPFAVSTLQLRADSQHIAPCPKCEEGEHRALCITCGGLGVVDSWLELRKQHRMQVVVAGSGPALERHPAVGEVADFVRSEWPNRLVHQAWFRSIPPGLSRSLCLDLDPDYERVVSLHVQTFVG